MPGRFEILGHGVDLHPEGAVLFPSEGCLVVSDVHLGKEAAFRAAGVPVPEGSNRRDLARLVALAKETSARELVVAGDLFHSDDGMSPETEGMFQAFLEEIGIPIRLVAGNHDRKVRRLPEGLEVVPVLHRGGIEIRHEPDHLTGDAVLAIAGHLHPVVKIPDGRRTSLRMPCFWLRDGVLVLPSFGSFTGGQVVHPKAGDRIFVAVGAEVREIPQQAWFRKR